MVPREVLRARLALAIRDTRSAEACAAVLDSLGFEVEIKSGRGVTFSGPKTLFEAAFAQPVALDPNPHFTGEPTIPASCENAESVYFPSAPILFENED